MPTATLDAVGSPSSDALPTKTGSSSILKGADGKPLITYIGAEYCPYCAAERWSLAVALSRFGTFSNLSGTHSSDSDVYPDTQTLSFYGSSYTSPYVDFQPVEEATNQPVGEQLPDPADADGGAERAAGQATTRGEHPVPRYREPLRRHRAPASRRRCWRGCPGARSRPQLNDPSSAVAQAIDGTANDITAAIMRGDRQPAKSVGSSADHCGDRPEAGGVTMAAYVDARRLPAGTALGAGRLARPVPGRGGNRVVSDSDALHRPGCAGLSRHRHRQLHARHDELVVRRARRPAGRARPPVGRGDDGTHVAVGLALRSRAGSSGARLVVSGAGAAMVLYLVYVELFRIGAICLWCTAMHVTAVCLFGVILAGRAASSPRVPAAT